ncbi:hypothetical protein B0H21DRAFT_868846 [Amylocystis lapponica]|nr:hypothetical protein B0H21DRAFT_868846 [Amylocystis lapponica]
MVTAAVPPGSGLVFDIEEDIYSTVISGVPVITSLFIPEDSTNLWQFDVGHSTNPRFHPQDILFQPAAIPAPQLYSRDGRTYTRPLGAGEAGFYWDSVFNGTADLISRILDLFTPENINRAWTQLKQRNPLLAVRVEEPDDGTESLHFLVTEKRLVEQLPGEIVFRSIADAEEASRVVEDIGRGVQRDSANLPGRLFILDRLDSPDIYHIIINTAHYMSDGVSHMALTPVFFEILASPHTAPAQDIPDLEERLTMLVSSEDLNPTLRLSKSRQRWRRALAAVILSIRESKIQGGQTIPGLFGPTTYRSPATWQARTKVVSPSIAARILENCHRNGVTPSAVFPVLSQLATARVLHRRHFRGEISEDEWEQRRQQPMHFFGPVNLRPYLDQQWRRKGGNREVMVSVGSFVCTLPFMPSINATEEPHPAPPLYLDITELVLQRNTVTKKTTALHWKAASRGETITDEAPPTVSVLGGGRIMSSGMSSAGNYDLFFPSEYPIPSTHPLSPRYKGTGPSQRTSAASSPSAAGTEVIDETLLHVDWMAHIHTRPTDLFLALATSQGTLRLQISWDGNVYDSSVICEWHDELVDALVWYLGSAPEAKGKL